MSVLPHKDKDFPTVLKNHDEMNEESWKLYRVSIRSFYFVPGDILPKQKKQSETKQYVINRKIQRSLANGAINEKVDGACFFGTWYKIAIPLKIDKKIIISSSILYIDIYFT